MSLLDRIKKAGDIKRIPENELKALAKEIRRELILGTSETGGHLGSNLGAVELTIALHRFLNFPEDKLIFDVGHQSYVHKMLTGRREEMRTLRRLDGLAGFPKRKESECDSFDTGHASTSISAAMGFVAAREILGTDEKVVAVIGDGAMTGGLALEALNNCGSLKSNLIIILNDNEMSIAENVGGVARYLGGIRTSGSYLKLKNEVKQAVYCIPNLGEKLFKKLKISKDSIKRLFVPGMFFEDMGLTYLGPIDGHNLKDLKWSLRNAERINGAVILHVITKKGKGYQPAEADPARFHGIDPFYVKTGRSKKKSKKESYTEIFSRTMLSLAEEEKRMVAITAAMPSGTGLTAFKEKYGNRFFDVGIAEEHAVTFSAGLAAAGMKPVVAIYSTFLQRAYDQILHDVCIQKLPVVFAVDRAGLVGSDGETHQGIFDVGYLSTIPELVIMAPKDGKEFQRMLRFALSLNRPVALRYPRGEAVMDLGFPETELILYKNEVLVREKDILLLASGKMVEFGLTLSKKLRQRGLSVSLVNLRFLDKIDLSLLEDFSKDHSLLVCLEENVFTGSYSERLMAAVKLCELDYSIMPFTLPDRFIEHGSVNELLERYGFKEEEMLEKVYAKALCLLDKESCRTMG